tara:strand:- start:60 stop:254 length:195 start_codon:yes stop_codon:yes gene_type:complete
MYLVGNFESSDYSCGELSLVGIVDNIKKQHLVNCSKDENYQVINLLNQKYYNAKENKWVKIQNW